MLSNHKLFISGSLSSKSKFKKERMSYFNNYYLLYKLFIEFLRTAKLTSINFLGNFV